MEPPPGGGRARAAQAWLTVLWWPTTAAAWNPAIMVYSAAARTGTCQAPIRIQRH